MNRQEVHQHFQEKFIKPTEKTFDHLLQTTIDKHHIEIENIFKNELRDLIQKTQASFYYVECAFLLSNALMDKPCFTMELYGEKWYFEPIAQTIFSIDFLRVLQKDYISS